MRADGKRRLAPDRRLRHWALAGLCLLLVLSASLYTLFQRVETENSAAVTIGGPFTLIDPHDRIVTNRNLLGRYVLVYFGYTGCPDVCPTTLNAVSQAIRLLGAKAQKVQPVFITIDPAHDTPKVLGQYVASFSPSLIGLTGSLAALRSVENAYHVIVRFGPDGIDHSAVLYLMAPDGAFLAPLPANSSAATIAADLNHYLG